MTKFISLPAFVLAAALILLGGCVPSEEDFIEDHPPPGSSGSSSGASPNGASLTCPSTLSGSGTISNPAFLGTAPTCFNDGSSIDVYYTVTIPTTGTWYFQIVNLTGDMDIFTFTDSTFSTPIGSPSSSTNSGRADDFVIINITSTGTGGIRVKHLSGGFNNYRLEVVQ